MGSKDGKIKCIEIQKEETEDIFSIWNRLKYFKWFEESFEEFIENIIASNNSDEFNKHIESSKPINSDLYNLYVLLEKYGINSLGFVI